MFYRFAKCVLRIYYTIFFKVVIIGKENIPKNGGVVICANHSSYHDPVVMATYAPRVVRYMAKQELFEHKLLSPIIRALYAFPVDRSGKKLSALKNSIKVLKNGDVIGIFAQGRRVKNNEEKGAKSGAALIAIQSKSPIVPTSIKSTFKPFSSIYITFGQPEYFDEYQGKRLTSDVLEEAVGKIMDIINKQLLEEH